MPNHPSLAFSIEDMNKLIRYGADRCDLVPLNLTVLVKYIKNSCLSILIIQAHK